MIFAILLPYVVMALIFGAFLGLFDKQPEEALDIWHEYNSETGAFDMVYNIPEEK